MHCAKFFRESGIYRMKLHLAGIPGEISFCKKVSHDIRYQMQQPIKVMKVVANRVPLGRTTCFQPSLFLNQDNKTM